MLCGGIWGNILYFLCGPVCQSEKASEELPRFSLLFKEAHLIAFVFSRLLNRLLGLIHSHGVLEPGAQFHLTFIAETP